MRKFVVCVVAILGASFGTSGAQQPRTSEDILRCLASPNPTTRDVCVRQGLASADAEVRANALATTFRNRRTIVVSFEMPAIVARAQEQVDRGLDTRLRGAPKEAKEFAEQAGLQLQFFVENFDAQTNTFSVISNDTNYSTNPTRAHLMGRGQGTLSGESLQITASYNPGTTGDDTRCNVSLSLHSANEMRGTVSCSGGNRTLPSTAARMRIF